MERPPSSVPRLWNTLPLVDQDYETSSLQRTMIMEHAPLEWTKVMERSPSSGQRLCNVLPREDHHYGIPSLALTKVMECLPLSGPR